MAHLLVNGSFMYVLYTALVFIFVSILFLLILVKTDKNISLNKFFFVCFSALLTDKKIV